MRFLNDTMQAVVLMVCQKHAPSLQEKLKQYPEGNWFLMPAIANCRTGYWPHVSASHTEQGCAIFGFVESTALARQLEKLASINADGSLCPDCVAYEWNVTPMHLSAAARDPVCGHSVTSNDALTHHYDGELFFFCGMNCRDAFKKAPQSYLHKPETVSGATETHDPSHPEMPQTR